MLSVDPVGNNRLDAQLLELGTIVVCVISLVSQQEPSIGQMICQHDRTGDVGGLTGCQIECQGTAIFITYGVNLGVSPAFCATDGLNKSPPFPPPAQRCALTWVLSIDISSGDPARAAVSSRNI